jgi:hypothetical protein
MYGFKMGDTSWQDSLFDVWALIMDTGIQYYALYKKPRFLAAMCAVFGMAFAAVLQGLCMYSVLCIDNHSPMYQYPCLGICDLLIY